MLTIVIVQSKVNGKWGYCPQAARDLLKLELSDDSPYPSARAAIEAAKNDTSIPKGSRFIAEGLYDGYEIGAVVELPAQDSDLVGPCESVDSMEIALQMVDKGEATRAFWSVYGHLPDGGVDCICDCYSEAHAEMVFNALKGE